MPVKKLLRRVLALVLAGALVLAALVWGLGAMLPDTFYVAPGTALQFAAAPWLQARQPAGTVAPADNTKEDTSWNTTLTLFGTLPIKTVRTVAVARRSVTVSGAPFGVKMFSNGALVVAFSDQYTVLGAENPAKEAGLRLGDLIVRAAGRTVRNNEEFSDAIAAAQGGAIEIVYLRGGAQRTCQLKPVLDRSSGVYRAGVWVRDSSAGIGTLTFADPLNHTCAGLGHAISDNDTGADIALLSGEIVPVVITGCQRGAAGVPGELRGEFNGGAALGSVLANDVTGVYGSLTGDLSGQSIELANIQEITPGAAQILTTVSGSAPQSYSVQIEKVNMSSADPNRNLLLRVTDEALLQATGGIIQGMSGSPILQNGRLVGAVTHVLVNDPTRGYGIFAQTMLTKADGVA